MGPVGALRHPPEGTQVADAAAETGRLQPLLEHLGAGLDRTSANQSSKSKGSNGTTGMAYRESRMNIALHGIIVQDARPC